MTDPSVDEPSPVPGRRLMNLRKPIRVATWNVQTLLRPGYAELLSSELKRYNITIAGICEARWPDSRERTVDDFHYIWSGPNDGRGLYGVSLALPAHLRSAIVSWRSISPRLLTARLHHRHGKITVIVAYGPTDIAVEQSKDAYQEQLTQLIQSVPPHDVTLVLTDANASLAHDAPDGTSPAIMGPVFVDTTTNDSCMSAKRPTSASQIRGSRGSASTTGPGTRTTGSRGRPLTTS